MFRGGRVSSYGTGIAAPLVPGYQSGGQIGGGIIYGRPMADGRYGFQHPDLFDVKDLIGETQIGAELGHLKAPTFKLPVVTEQQSALDLAGDIEGVHIEPEIASYDKETEIEIDDYNYIPKGAVSDVSEGLDESWAVDKKEEGPEWHEDIYIDEEGILQHKKDDTLKKEIPDDPNLAEIARLQAIIDAKTEPVEIDARTAVAEKKALFADLLGIDKARGQDIGDMALLASAKLLKPGATVRSGLGEFMEAEAVRPGRKRKLEDAAATLAIQDYIAGKKSKEDIKQLMAIEDYKPRAKLKAMMPNLDDTAQIALAKFASLNDSKSSSDSTIKDFIKFKTGENVFRNDKIKKIDDVEKKKNKLKIGYNIIEEDGIKIFVKWDGTNYDILTLNEIWAGK